MKKSINTLMAVLLGEALVQRDSIVIL